MPSVSTTRETPANAVLPDFAGLVLAGGASSRMGEDKACLYWKGRTLLEHAVRRLAEAGANPVLVSGDRPEWDGIPDTVPGQGPLGGLLSVLEQRPGLGQRILVITPVDVPALPSRSLLPLVYGVAEASRAAHFRGHPLPMAVRVTGELIDTLRDLLSGEGAAVRELAGRLDALSLEEDEANLSNLNTPCDWNRFQETAN